MKIGFLSDLHLQFELFDYLTTVKMFQFYQKISLRLEKAMSSINDCIEENTPVIFMIKNL